MSEWKNFSLGDVVEFNPAERIVKGTLAKKIAMEKLQPFCRDVLGFEVEKYYGGVKFRNDDTIMARITPCLENGKTAKVSVLDDNEIGFGSTEFIVFRAKKNVSIPDFVYYLIRSKLVREPAIKSMVGTSGRQRVQTDYVKNIIINLPPLETQKKIAAVLSALDDKIELNNAINKNLEEQAQAIYKNMFPAVTSNETSVGEYVIPKRGKSLSAKNAIRGDVPVVAGGLEPAFYHNSANTESPVLTISASGNAGYVRLWNIPVWSSDSSFIDSSITEDVYFWYVMLKLRQEEIFHLRTGTAQQHIYPKHIAQLPIKKLDEHRVTAFTERVTPLFSMIGENIQENKKLGELRDALLPRLMSGEIDVSKVDITYE